GAGRHPARFHVQLRYPPVIAIEEGKEVLGQVAVIDGTEGAHDAKVYRDVLRILRAIRVDEDVARVHVAVEKAVAEYLGEKDLHTPLGEYPHIDVQRPQGGNIVDRNASSTLHHHHLAACVIPVHFGHIQQRGTQEIALELGGAGRFAHQV